MIIRLLHIILLIGGLGVTSAWSQSSPRLQVTLNDGWLYADGRQPGAEAVGFADSTWARVDVPHTWNADDAFDETPGYRRGIGWYRRTLQLDSALAGRRLFLYFEGANQVADVYLNGQHLGQHVGGYTAFSFEMTEQARLGASNVLAVRVDNRHDPDIPPLDADFTFYGGIYRDVWLVATAPVHLDLLDHAGPGVYADTPEVTEGQATVRLRARVVNDRGTDAAVDVRHRILDAEGLGVATVEAQQTVPAGTAHTFTTQAVIEAPRRWSPEDPHVYRVVTEVYADGALTDTRTTPLGVRRVAVDGNGVMLNGQPYALVGTNRHQDFPGLGNALPDAYHRRDVRHVKDTGFNFLRLAHYPQDPAVLHATDRLGLAVWEEIPVVNTITMNEAFTANAERMLVEMIRQHYNHPSIVIWGLMNEALLRKPDPMPEGYLAAVRSLAEHLHAVARREDPYRPTALAASFHEVYDGSGVSDVTDILGMNLYFGWYYGDFADFGPFLDSLHTVHPERPLLVSEYGAGSDERVHAREPVAFDFSAEHAQNYHLASFPQLQARGYLAGSAVWNQFDFGSSHRQDTKNGINQKGLYFFDRTPKDVAFYYRALLTDAPVLHVEREHRHRAGRHAADRVQPVQVYANADRVTLSRDGELVGEGVPENGRIVFDVPFESGVNRIEARGAWGEHARADRVTMHFDDRTGCFERVEPCVDAVNVGGHYDVTDPSGLVYLAEFPRGVPSEGGAGRTHHRIYGTDDDPLFQAYRVIEADASLPSPHLMPGTYELTFGFMEPTYDAPGQRVFSVRVNGAPVITDLDLAAEAGRWTAVERTVRLEVHEPTTLALQFVPTQGSAVLSSLLIHRH